MRNLTFVLYISQALACDPIAAYKIDDIHGWNQKVQNRLYDFGRRASTAVNVLAVLSVLEEDFGSFMERGMVSLSSNRETVTGLLRY